jgi:hypothetical protein
MFTFEIIPDKEIVGVTDILSEKLAVIVTTSEFETILSESLLVRVTDGFVVSNSLKLITTEVVLLCASETFKINL